MHSLTHLVTIVLTHQRQHVVFHETKLTSFPVSKFSQCYIGKFIASLGPSVLSVGLVQILRYWPGGLV